MASSSPRRADLLARAGIDFVLAVPGPEPAAAGGPVDRALARAVAKARGAVLPDGAIDGAPVLGVDTVVALDGREYGKPVDAAAAAATLTALAGRCHDVHTAHCVVPSGGGRAATAVTSAVVRIASVEGEPLRCYLATGDWRGKAGAYGIQDAGADFAELVAGELDTVVGLSVAAVRALLERAAR